MVLSTTISMEKTKPFFALNKGGGDLSESKQRLFNVGFLVLYIRGL